MKPKVYVETSVLSYLAARPSRDPITAGRQVITRRWWENERKKYTLVGLRWSNWSASAGTRRRL